MLDVLLSSLACMKMPEEADVELRIADNDAAASAKKLVESFRMRTHAFSGVSYRVVGERNIAVARNACIDMGEAEWVVFVDDDERVHPMWLIHLWKAQFSTTADALFGPVKGECLTNQKNWFIENGFFDKDMPETGVVIDWTQTRTSNTWVSGSWFYGQNRLRFDVSFGKSGGSDTALFSIMQQLGATLVSCSNAVVYESIPETRACIGWLTRRFYRNGLIYERVIQNTQPTSSCVLRAAKRLGKAAYLMLSGLLSAMDRRILLQGWLRLPLALGGLVAGMSPKHALGHDAYRVITSQVKKKRVAFLTNIISPYRKPVFENLAKVPDWDFRVYINSKTEFDRKWEVSEQGLSVRQSFSFRLKRRVRSLLPVPFEQIITLHIPVGLLFDLFRFRPDIVISHELGVRTGIAAVYSALCRKPLVIWAYQSRISGTQGSWRNGLRRLLLKRATCVVGMGFQAREVLLKWGVPDYKIIDAPNASDSRALEMALKDVDAQQKIRDIRQTVGGSTRLAIVVGRLVPLKGIDALLKVWKTLPIAIKDRWTLVFVGEGPLVSLVNAANDASIKQVGHVDWNSIALWYAAADLHVFATYGDVWGLAVNEAAFCGTPTLCSIHAGCVDDLIFDGVNGFRVDFSLPEVAREKLLETLERDDLSKIGQRAKEASESFTVDRMARSFRKAVTMATQHTAEA